MSVVITFIQSWLPRTVPDGLTAAITMFIIFACFSSAAHAAAKVF
jgi:hypothetical protein